MLLSDVFAVGASCAGGAVRATVAADATVGSSATQVGGCATVAAGPACSSVTGPVYAGSATVAARAAGTARPGDIGQCGAGGLNDVAGTTRATAATYSPACSVVATLPTATATATAVRYPARHLTTGIVPRVWRPPAAAEVRPPSADVLDRLQIQSRSPAPPSLTGAITTYRSIPMPTTTITAPPAGTTVGTWTAGPNGTDLRPVSWPTATVAGVVVVVAGVQDQHGKIRAASAFVDSAAADLPLDAVQCRQLAAALTVAADRLDRLRLN